MKPSPFCYLQKSIGNIQRKYSHVDQWELHIDFIPSTVHLINTGGIVTTQVTL